MRWWAPSSTVRAASRANEARVTDAHPGWGRAIARRVGTRTRTVRGGPLVAVILCLAVASPGIALAADPSAPESAVEGELDAGLAPAGAVPRSTGLEEEAEFEGEEEVGLVHDPDPWEKVNRRIFWLNELGDRYFVLPLSRGWRFVTPAIVRTGIDNFNGLLLMPVIFANGVFQLKPKNAVQDLGRIIYNATFGVAGFIDIATMVGIPQNDEDFGQTLGFWGAPPGPYLVLPVFGPSNVRDGIGRLGDTAATYYTTLLPIYVTFIVRSVELVNIRARYIEEVDENRRESFDYYVFLRDAYLQNREVRVGRARERFERTPEQDDDLYYFDDEEEDEDEVEENDEGSTDDGAGRPGPHDSSRGVDPERPTEAGAIDAD